MNTEEIGKELVQLCRAGKNLEAIDLLYSPDIVSVEASPMPGMQQTETGILAIKAKNQWWNENHEIHGGDVHGPFPHGNRFIAHFTFDVTPIHLGQRMTMEEMALYTVDHGKIVREEFFYVTE